MQYNLTFSAATPHKPLHHYAIADSPRNVRLCAKMLYYRGFWSSPAPDQEAVSLIRQYEDDDRLTINEGRDGRDYIWYLDGTRQAIACISTGWISRHPGRDVRRLFL